MPRRLTIALSFTVLAATGVFFFVRPGEPGAHATSHAGIHKIFRVSDSPSAPLFRVELTTTNLFNQAQWGNPNVNVTPTNVAAATIRSTGGPTSWQQAGARTMRLGLRVEW